MCNSDCPNSHQRATTSIPVRRVRRTVRQITVPPQTHQCELTVVTQDHHHRTNPSHDSDYDHRVSAQSTNNMDTRQSQPETMTTASSESSHERRLRLKKGQYSQFTPDSTADQPVSTSDNLHWTTCLFWCIVAVSCEIKAVGENLP